MAYHEINIQYSIQLQNPFFYQQFCPFTDLVRRSFKLSGFVRLRNDSSVFLSHPQIVSVSLGFAFLISW